jgi:hypothetical protein
MLFYVGVKLRLQHRRKNIGWEGVGKATGWKVRGWIPGRYKRHFSLSVVQNCSGAPPPPPLLDSFQGSFPKDKWLGCESYLFL